MCPICFNDYVFEHNFTSQKHNNKTFFKYLIMNQHLRNIQKKIIEMPIIFSMKISSKSQNITQGCTCGKCGRKHKAVPWHVDYGECFAGPLKKIILSSSIKLIFVLLCLIFQALMLHTYIADTMWKCHQDWIKIEVTISKNANREFRSRSAPLIHDR